MNNQMIVAAGLIAITILFHGVFIAIAGKVLSPFTRRVHTSISFLRDLIVLVLLGLWLMLAHFLEIAIWAKTYQWIGVQSDFETAFYFSSLCYTTLGLGGFEIEQAWRWLPGANAANGFLLFGMSAACLMGLFNR